jgi:hypothetical protein
MVGFGDKLMREEWPEWRPYYLDYEGLKTKIDELAALKDDPSIPPVVCTAKEHIFQGMLDSEIEKARGSPFQCMHGQVMLPRWECSSMTVCMSSQVLAFYKDKLADVRKRLPALQAERSGAHASSHAGHLDQLTDKLRDLACAERAPFHGS